LSELPKKKVLKQAITKLKSKSMTSLESYTTYVTILSQEDRTKMQSVVLMLGILKNDTMQLVISAR